jgi:acyl-CoA thioester hydrolase
MREHGEDGAADARLLGGVLTRGGHAYVTRIYYADTDFSGFVYHARYLEFFERGRSDFLRLAGLHHTDLASGADMEPVVWVVRRMEIDFVSPARMDDLVRVETRVEAISGARITMRQIMLRGGAELARASVEAVTVTPQGRPRRFPKDWLLRLSPAAPVDSQG